MRISIHLSAHSIYLMFSANLHFAASILCLCMMLSKCNRYCWCITSLLIPLQYEICASTTCIVHVVGARTCNVLCISIFIPLCSFDYPCDMDHVSETNTQKKINQSCKSWTSLKFCSAFWLTFSINTFATRWIAHGNIHCYRVVYLKTARATVLAELCNSITCQRIELESCSNPQQIQQVF